VSARTTETKVRLPLIDARRPDAGVEPRRAARSKGRICEFDSKKMELATRRLNSLVDLQSARIADVLHDDTSQVLASAHITLEDIARDLPPSAQARLHQVRQHLHDVADQLRRISHDLHPGIVDVLGTIDAIKFTARAFTHQTGVQLAIDVDLDQGCPAKPGAVLFRVVQEALNNIGEHAHAASASIAIAREDSRLVCTVCDDGVGFDVAAAPPGSAPRLGLALIRARLEALGGTLDITSVPQQGTRLRAAVPLEI
jgi:signal transduction histidine kinase